MYLYPGPSQVRIVLVGGMYRDYQANPPTGVDQHVAGLALLNKNDGKPSVVPQRGFPGLTTRLSKRTSLKYLIDVRNTKYREERVMTLYTTLATAALRNFLTVEDYEVEDYHALNATLHSMFSNYGQPAFENWLSGRDISETILQVLGTGIRSSDPIHGLSVDFFIDMFDWAIMFGWQLARAVPQAEVINILLDSNELNAYRKLNFFHNNYVDMASYGTKSEPHYIMPTNHIKPGEFMLPCAVRSSKHKEGWNDYVNTWEWLDGITYPNQKAVTVAGRNIEIPFEDQTTKTWYRLMFKSDAETGRGIKGLTDRPIKYFRFPVFPLYYIDEDDDTDKRKYNWIMGLFTMGNQVMKDGYRVEPFFEALKGVNGKLRVWVDSRGELRLVDVAASEAAGKIVLDDKVTAAPLALDTESEIMLAQPREKPKEIEQAIAVEVVADESEVTAEVDETEDVGEQK